MFQTRGDVAMLVIAFVHNQIMGFTFDYYGYHEFLFTFLVKKIFNILNTARTCTFSVLHYITLHYIVLYCIVLYCIV